MKQPSHSLKGTETGGRVLSNDSMIDLVRSDNQHLELVVWDGSSASIVSRFDWNGTIFVAPTAHEEIVKLVPFPNRVKNCVATTELFDSLRVFFALHRGLPDESISILAYFTLATWFPECPAIWPALSIVTSDAVSSTSLLRLMRCAFRRPVQLANVTLRGLLSLPSWLRPTLLIDQPAPSQEVNRTLRMISRGGGLVLGDGHLRKISCPTVICSAEPLADSWLLHNTIQVAVIPTRQRSPMEPEFLAQALQDLQGKLLAYRLKILPMSGCHNSTRPN